MGKIMNEKLRLCRIDCSGFIPELGYIQGPVRKCKLSTAQIRLLVGNGKKIYELNPSNPSEEVRLTMTNCAIPQFEKPTAEEGSKEEVKETIPQVPVEDEAKTETTEPEKEVKSEPKYNKYDKYNKNKKNEYKKESSEKIEEADIQ